MDFRIMTVEGRTYKLVMDYKLTEACCTAEERSHILKYQDQIPREMRHLIFTFGGYPKTYANFDGKKWVEGGRRDYFWYFHFLIRLS